MKRHKIIVRGPALSSSGYGEQTRFALRSLRKHQDKFDIYLVNVGWGRTGWIITNDEERQWIDELIGKTMAYINSNPNNVVFDVSLQVTIPNEFEPLAPVNVGYTAGIETNKVAQEWIEKSNKMHKVITTSNHSRDVLLNTSYKLKTQFDKEVDLKVTSPVETVGYAARLVEPEELKIDLKTDFNFLCVAQWGPRKNVEQTISSFVSEFNKEENVGLIIKANIIRNSVYDKMVVKQRLNGLLSSIPQAKNMKCKIYLLHGNMSEAEMRGLYTNEKVKALVTTSHGEGFGLPVFESVLSGLPVISPAWSGQVDFLFAPKKDKETGKIKLKPHFSRIEFGLQQVQKDAVVPGLILEDAQWCFAKAYSVRSCMRDVFKNYEPHLSNAKKLKEFILEEFDANKQYDKFSGTILELLPALEVDPSEIEMEMANKNVLTDIIGL